MIVVRVVTAPVLTPERQSMRTLHTLYSLLSGHCSDQPLPSAWPAPSRDGGTPQPPADSSPHRSENIILMSCLFFYTIQFDFFHKLTYHSILLQSQSQAALSITTILSPRSIITTVGRVLATEAGQTTTTGT